MIVPVPVHDVSMQTVRATSSASEPAYVRLTGGSRGEVSTGEPGACRHAVVWGSLSELIAASEGPLTPDWTAWAEILAFGAPLAGRTPFAGVRRLQPGEEATVQHTCPGRAGPQHSDADASCSAQEPAPVVVRQQGWSWLDVEPEPGLRPEKLTVEVLELLRAEVRSAAPEGALHPMLSGGRDSRLLAALAVQEQPEGLTAWTTSSDTGTSMEELVAARVAAVLDLKHRIVPAEHGAFPQDVRDYAQVVDHMASFHIWLMPVSRALRQAAERSDPGTVLDGLGGGIFLGGGFPEDPALAEGSPSAARILDSRFARMGRYLDAAEEVLAPQVGEELRERARADFDQVAAPLADHPNGATLTAYLTRTLPGISLAPAKVLSSAQPARTPIMADEVITRALRIPHRTKADGLWYRDLLAQTDPQIAALPTAAELTRRRQHIRRISSRESAQWLRELVLGSPASELLSESMRLAPPEEWAEHLAKTKPQHLIRGLAMLALWLEEYGDRLTSVQPPFAASSGAQPLGPQNQHAQAVDGA